MLRSFLVSVALLTASPALADAGAAQSKPMSAEVSTALPGLVSAARKRLASKVRYDPAYIVLKYPGGDVAPGRGVCSDVIIRSYRNAYGYDFQKTIHEDMKAAFSEYSTYWGLKKPDKNIDHRRVLNLETFLERQGASVPITRQVEDYKPGDVVSWRLGGRMPHIGIVSERESAAGIPMIIHNVGAGPKEEDILFDNKIIGHYRFHPQG